MLGFLGGHGLVGRGALMVWVIRLMGRVLSETGWVSTWGDYLVGRAGIEPATPGLKVLFR
ncbi:MAG: hypothetical protein DSY79_10220 [Chloroflexi bacterium]|nr:MAG: hypothetical protein DSY79_10220 [Chloroflexota bacterium]RUA32430.1 MAG: hypothetical protein DSY78_03375 [Chloroflexota bacterium]